MNGNRALINHILWGSVLLVWATVHVAAADAPIANVSESNRFAWSDTTGWIEVATNDPQALRIMLDGTNAFLAGFAHSDTLGPIAFGYTNAGPYANTSTTDWGVNLSPTWDLYGFAWSPAAGWIEFSALTDASIHQQYGFMKGFSDSSEIGLIRWGEDPDVGLPYGIVFDLELNAQDLPLWWIHLYGETNELGEVTNADVFFAGTSASPVFDAVGVSGEFIFDTVSRRYYTIEASTNLLAPADGWLRIQQISGSGDPVFFQPQKTQPQEFYRFTVGLDPDNGGLP